MTQLPDSTAIRHRLPHSSNEYSAFESPQQDTPGNAPSQEIPGVSGSMPHPPTPAHEYAEAVRQWLWQRQCVMEMNLHAHSMYSMFAMNCAAAASVASMIPPPSLLGPRIGVNPFTPQPAAPNAEPGVAGRGAVPGVTVTQAGNGAAAPQFRGAVLIYL